MTKLKILNIDIFACPIRIAILSLLVSLFIDIHPTFAQVSEHQKSFIIQKSPFENKIHMGGLLDADNTSTYSSDGRLIREFEPMVSLSISNRGKTSINSPRLLINNKSNWFSLDMMIEDFSSHVSSNREKALALWRFMTDNRMHAASPAHGCDISDPINLLGIFGYATCAATADAVTSIGAYLGLPARKWHLSADYQNHTFAEVDFGDGYVIIDPDAQVFYLDYDNCTLLGKDAVELDGYLIHRTHHFGKSSRSNFAMASLYNGVIAESGPSACSGASLDINLRPGETILYHWQEPDSYFHNILPANFSTPFPITNDKIIYDVPISAVNLSELLYSYSNIILDRNPDGDPFIRSAALNKKSEFIIKMKSPFILLDSQIIFKWFQATEHNRITLDFSADKSKWQKVWNSSKSGFQQTGINLTSYIKELPAKNRHDIYLRFKLMPKSRSEACGISAIKIISTFQASRFFMPHLQLGENLIAYTDETLDERNIEVDIKWRESAANSPPKAVAAPLFPQQNGETTSLQFTFKWTAANDPDEDAIIDYHFQLSDHEDMSFPLSPNFDIYVSAVQEKVQAEFSIPWPGLLNNGTTYFWRVRAKDGRGAWSRWSRVWSFVARGIMMPVAGRVINDSDGNVELHWHANPNGARPAFYQIHGSNAPNGFTPDSDSFVCTSKYPKYRISSTAFKYYRVISVDAFNQASGPSKVISVDAVLQ